MDINSKIFKAYDIRGIYPDEVNEEVAEFVGRGFTEYTKSKQLVVARDVRVSGPSLHAALIKGIIDQGADVLDIGQASTDLFYFACGSKGLPGVNVTASHNPAEHNGFKLVEKMPDLVGGEAFYEAVRPMHFPSSPKKGNVRPLDIKEAYRQKILSLADTSAIPKGLTIVVDPANGMGGVAYDMVYRDIPVKTVKLFLEPDGTFPNHGGDPLREENRRDLEAKVKEQGADLGFAFDTDADRFFAVDQTGAYVPSDFLGALFAQYFIERHGGGTIVQDALIGWAMRDLVKEAGGEIFMSRVGHVFIKKEMEDSGLPGVILGKSFKPESNIQTGSPAILVANMLEAQGVPFEHYEFDHPEELPKAVYLIATEHKNYSSLNFPPESVVVDPFRFIPQKEGVRLVPIGGMASG